MGRGAEEAFFQIRHTDGQQACEKIFKITNYQGNANQNHNEIFMLVRMAIIKKTRNNKRQRKGNNHTLLVGMEIGAATLKDSMQIPQNIKNRTII